MADDVNTQVQDLLLRRAVARSEYENDLLRAITARLRVAAVESIAALRMSGALDGVKPPMSLAAFGLPGYIPATFQRQKIEALMATLGGFWRAARSDVGRMLQQALLDYAELDMLEMPQEVGALLQRAARAPIQEAAGDPPGVSVSFTSVPAGQVAQLATSPLGGGTFEQALEDLSSRLLARVRAGLTTGLLQGQGVPKVARTIQGAMQNARWEAERIVRSEFTRVAAQSALVQYQQNRDLIQSVQWVATLDDRTCLQCGALDGETWDSAADADVPVVDTHPLCRCVLVPVIKDAEDLGLEPSTRASFSGQVPETMQYPTFFRKQSAKFQRTVLGPTRYRLWRQGRLTLGDFATAAGVRSVSQALALARAKGRR
jgi:SPP1 gp7 family putative phage head morphogenesis protein